MTVNGQMSINHRARDATPFLSTRRGRKTPQGVKCNSAQWPLFRAERGVRRDLSDDIRSTTTDRQNS